MHLLWHQEGGGHGIVLTFKICTKHYDDRQLNSKLEKFTGFHLRFCQRFQISNKGILGFRGRYQNVPEISGFREGCTGFRKVINSSQISQRNYQRFPYQYLCKLLNNSVYIEYQFRQAIYQDGLFMTRMLREWHLWFLGIH